MDVPPISEPEAYGPDDRTDPGGGPRDVRWRVVLVRVPKAAREQVDRLRPGHRPLRTSDLPLVVRVTERQSAAEHSAARLRALGCTALVVSEPSQAESAFCETHTSNVAARGCVVCQQPVCAMCVQDAGGDIVCRKCRRRGRGPRMRVRRRQLFVVFLFSVFLFEVVAYLRRDAESVDPSRSVRVGIFQFVPPDQPMTPLVRALNSLPEPGQPAMSLGAIQGWFNAERARYGGPSSYLNIDVMGPWGRQVSPPMLDDPSLSSWELAWRAYQYVQYFKNLVVDQGVDPDDYAARVYVIYSDNPGDLASHSRGSENGHVAVVYVNLYEPNPGYAALTVAHELAHTLGAVDLYDEDTSLAVHPKGFVEPFARPLYPQRFAELMAGDVPIGHNQEREVTSLDEVRIGHASAFSMGWIGKGAMKLFYMPAAETPEDRLPPRSPSAAAQGGTTEGVERSESSRLVDEDADVGAGVVPAE